MKKNSLLIIIVIILAIFGIVFLNNKKKEPKEKLYYIPLGDSVAQGMNDQGMIGKGYTDFIKEYLDKEDRLIFYTKNFTKSGYTTENVKADIESNRKIEVNGETIYIQDALKNANLITLTIGANDFIHGLDLTNYTSKLEDMDATKLEINAIFDKVEELVKLIKTYNDKQIILTGYYNPFPNLEEYWVEINDLVEYYNAGLYDISVKEEVDFVDLNTPLFKNTKALPNPYDIHPSEYGHSLIADEIIKIIK